jgi:hypothetical protein
VQIPNPPPEQVPVSSEAKTPLSSSAAWLLRCEIILDEAQLLRKLMYFQTHERPCELSGFVFLVALSAPLPF